MVKIGLDAGHGLKTSGKQTPNKIKEWTLNDRVRDKVVTLLKDYDVEIINTDNDEGNIDEGLATRRNMYVNSNVNVACSLHHNGLDGKWGKHTGVEVYVDRNATEEDLKLAEAIYKRLVEYTGLKGRGIKRANFTVIYQNKVPACLIEGGFMDSTIDYPVITSDKGQNAYARAVAEGIIEYLGLKKKNVSQTTNQSNTTNTSRYKVGDRVKVSSYYGSSTDPVEKAIHKTATGTITKIVSGARNPYLLENGNIGWCNDGDIRGYIIDSAVEYYPKCKATYLSITSALNSIGVNSSMENRKKIALVNGIKKYTGTAIQNISLLTKLKAGRLRKS